MLKARFFTALLLVTGLLAILFLLPPNIAALVFIPVVSLGGWEWGGLMRRSRARRAGFVFALTLGCLLVWLAAPESFVWLWAVAALFWLGLVPVWLYRGWPLQRHGLFAGFLVLLPAWAGLTALLTRDPWLLLAVMAAVWVADIAAYAAGRTFGRHKLAPTISPGKTWEGAAGAALAALLYGWLVSPWLPQLRGLGAGALAASLLLLVAMSIVGDLFESLAKRQAGQKDSGELLPGHGGVLDRIDSLTPTLPLAALALHFSA
ncbi:MAG: phosphatidate cytidylyltransferase [Rhodocyclaceae bacterium]|nr:phosphatidate cytidylyltransferase [Rhodocyclaceae bacterium]